MPAPPVPRVSAAEARRLMAEEGYLYLDVRSEPEYAAGHPAGAHNVPLGSADFLDVVEALYPKDAKIVVGCATGVRSLHAARMMLEAGYVTVAEQRAGMDGARGPFGELREAGWAALGLPVELETPGGSFAELLVRAGLD